jgi:ATP-dependent helicase/DNAse subunit B
MENIYLKETKITSKFIDRYLQDNKITQETKNRITEAFESQYFGAHIPLEEYNGEQLIFFRVVSQMIENTLIYDKSTTPFEILGLEEKHDFEIKIGKEKILIGGIIDRIDKKDDTIRIVDYKTGKAADPKNDYSKTLEEIFNESRKKKSAYLLQTFLYSSILCSENKFFGKKVQPLLVFALTADSDNYSPCLSVEEKEIDDFNEYKNEFDLLLHAKIRELFDANTPFYRREKDDYCQICDYSEICERKTRL